MNIRKKNKSNSENTNITKLNICFYCRNKIEKNSLLHCFVCKEISCIQCASAYYDKYKKSFTKDNFLCKKCLLLNSKIS